MPGAVAGLGAAHAAYARIPWAELIAPAARLAREGLDVNTQQGFLQRILDPILRAEPEGKRIYGGKAPLQPGERLRMPALADTLDRLAAEGPDGFYRGDVGRAISAAVQERGGSLTRTDLESYRVIRRRPVRVPYRRWEFVSNPPPSAGGLLIAYALSVLDRLGDAGERGSAQAIAALAEVMREAQLARGSGFLSGLSRGGLPRRLLTEENLAAAARRARKRVRQFAPEPAGLPSTTHISVVDAHGNAASLSASTGCGSGVIVPGTGIHMNNMLGEEDLNPGGREGSPGNRLTSMMAPSIVLERGTAAPRGRERRVDPPARRHPAVRRQRARPRPHRPGGDRGAARSSRGRGAPARGRNRARHRRRARVRGLRGRSLERANLYFGGASAVGLGAEGELEAAGDPRRGGAGAVVE